VLVRETDDNQISWGNITSAAGGLTILHCIEDMGFCHLYQGRC